MTNVAVLLPGIMGSQLCLGSDVIWPGPLTSLIGEYKRMTDLLRPELVATDVLRNYGIFSIYDPLISDLEDCDFKENGNPKTLYVFPYDWRKSNYESAGLLAGLIDRIRASIEGDLKIILIGHSMGGLVSRCYLESGGFAQRQGFDCVKTLITIGTPHRGAALTAVYAVGLQKQLFLSKSQVQQLANDPRYPSAYELLPAQDEMFAWPYEDSAQLKPLDIYSQATAQAMNLSMANIQASIDFQKRLDLARKPTDVRYFAFYGTRLKTTMNIRLEQYQGVLKTSALSVDDGGDGTVPVWSALRGVQSMPVGEEHMKLFRDASLRTTLSILLGAPGRLAAPAEIRVVANARVVETDSLVSVVLLFPGGTTQIDGAVRWVKLSDTGEPGQPEGDSARVQYGGAPVDKIGLQLPSPPFGGFYSLEFTDASGAKVVPDQVVVQQKSN